MLTAGWDRNGSLIKHATFKILWMTHKLLWILIFLSRARNTEKIGPENVNYPKFFLISALRIVVHLDHHVLSYLWFYHFSIFNYHTFKEIEWLKVIKIHLTSIIYKPTHGDPNGPLTVVNPGASDCIFFQSEKVMCLINVIPKNYFLTKVWKSYKGS